MKGVLMTKMVQELNLTNLTPEIDLSDHDGGNQPSGTAADWLSGAFCK
jgi:hypothetical protein